MSGRPAISVIVAMDLGGVIGAGGDLPWRLPADLRWFRANTLGKPVVMGRKTHESIGRVLPGRENIVVSRDRGLRIGGCTVVAGLDEALEAARPAAEAMVVGGAQIYALALPRAARLYLTTVLHRFEGDTVFPDHDPGEWRQTLREDHAPDERNPWPYRFQIFERDTSPHVSPGFRMRARRRWF